MKHAILLLTFLGVILSPPMNAQITATQVGMLDFQIDQQLTAADMNGTNDVTEKLRQSIKNAQNSYRTLFIPSGTYRVSGQIECTLDEGANPHKPTNIVGSSIRHPLIVLANNSPGFGDELLPKAVFTYKSTNVNHKSDWVMQGGMRALDFDLGESNAGAVAIYWGSAQYCYIEDMNFNIRSGFAGLTSVGGANCLFSNLSFDGGKHGIFLPDSNTAKTWNMLESPQNTTLGCSFINQRSTPIVLWGWGGITLIGMTIVSSVSPAIKLNGSSYSSVIQFPFSMIDSKIEFKSHNASNVIFDNNTTRCNVSLRGIYTKNAAIICANSSEESLKPLGAEGDWTHVNRYDYIAKTMKTDDAKPFNKYTGVHYNANTGTQYTAEIVEVENKLPPADLVSKHVYSHTPSFEDAGVHLVPSGASADQIQNAINAHPKVCLAKGEYRLNKPITLRANTVLFGCPGRGVCGSILYYAWKPTGQTWLIDSESSADGTAYLMDVTTDPDNFDYQGSLRWRVGANSIIRDVRFDMGWDHLERDMIRILFTENGGGRVFNYQDEKSFSGSVIANSPNHRKVKALGTSQQLTFYGLNLERGGSFPGESSFPLFEIKNSSNIRILGAKTETYQPYVKIINSQNIFLSNIIDYTAINAGRTTRNLIEIEGNSDNIEIANAVWLKPPVISGSTPYLIIKDPWNNNTPHRLMNLGLYHRGWSTFHRLLSSSANQITVSENSIYPNPATSFVNVKCQDGANVTIYNMNGMIVKTNESQYNSTRINISNLPNGVYSVIIIDNQQQRKVVKMIKI